MPTVIVATYREWSPYTEDKFFKEDCHLLPEHLAFLKKRGHDVSATELVSKGKFALTKKELALRQHPDFIAAIEAVRKAHAHEVHEANRMMAEWKASLGDTKKRSQRYEDAKERLHKHLVNHYFKFCGIATFNIIMNRNQGWDEYSQLMNLSQNDVEVKSLFDILLAVHHEIEQVFNLANPLREKLEDYCKAHHLSINFDYTEVEYDDGFMLKSFNPDVEYAEIHLEKDDDGNKIEQFCTFPKL